MTPWPVGLISVRSPHVDRILDGSKTIEFRRKTMNLPAGSVLLLYAAGGRRALVGSVTIGEIRSGSPGYLWRVFGSRSGLQRREFDAYFEGSGRAHAIPITSVRRLAVSIPLAELRTRCPSFTAPQTHRIVQELELDQLLNGERHALLPNKPSSEFDLHRGI